MNADAVIVGAGVVGASVAWHLASLGMRRVVLLEREPATGRGSTAKATGGFRAQFATEINVRLSLLSREKLRRFQDEVGADPGYRPCGYLWLARTPAQLARLAEAQQLQHRLGLTEARLVDEREIAALNPAVNAQGLAGAAFCPTDGFLRPLDILRGYLEAAQRSGVTLIHSAAPLEFRKAGARIVSVRLATEEISTTCVIDAGGAWADAIARLAGVTLPVTPLRRQVASTVPCSLLPEDMPMTLFVEDSFHLRVRDGRVLLLLPTPGNPADRYDMSVEPEWLARVTAIAAERVPVLANVPLDRDRCWAGLYEMSPDKHAVVGAGPECENLIFANGSSGHGVMHAPALGQLVAEMVVHGRARSLDASALRPTRFAEGFTNPSSDVL